jgi:hypothetical protein
MWELTSSVPHPLKTLSIVSRVHGYSRGGGNSEWDAILRYHAFDILFPVFWNTEFATPVHEGDEEGLIIGGTEQEVLEIFL